MNKNNLRVQVSSLPNQVGYKNIVSIEVLDKDFPVGIIYLGEPIKNMFIDSNGKPELEILRVGTSDEYYGEGIEAILIDTAIEYSQKLNRLLFINESNYFKKLTHGIFERRGFKFQPVVYQVICFILGESFTYNLENIEKDCHEFLQKDSDKYAEVVIGGLGDFIKLIKSINTMGVADNNVNISSIINDLNKSKENCNIINLELIIESGIDSFEKIMNDLISEFQ